MERAALRAAQGLARPCCAALGWDGPSLGFASQAATPLRWVPARAEFRGGFDVVLVDPPWENRSVRRGSVYATIPGRNLLALPVVELMRGGGGPAPLLALWVTNRERLRRFIDAELLPAWGLEHRATWYWLKLDTEGNPVTPLVCRWREGRGEEAEHGPHRVAGQRGACALAAPGAGTVGLGMGDGV